MMDLEWQPMPSMSPPKVKHSSDVSSTSIPMVVLSEV